MDRTSIETIYASPEYKEYKAIKTHSCAAYDLLIDVDFQNAMTYNYQAICLGDMKSILPRWASSNLIIDCFKYYAYGSTGKRKGDFQKLDAATLERFVQLGYDAKMIMPELQFMYSQDDEPIFVLDREEAPEAKWGYLYISIAYLRHLRDDQDMVRKILHLIDQGVDMFYAYSFVIPTMCRTPGHEFLPIAYSGRTDNSLHWWVNNLLGVKRFLDSPTELDKYPKVFLNEAREAGRIGSQENFITTNLKSNNQQCSRLVLLLPQFKELMENPKLNTAAINAFLKENAVTLKSGASC